MELYKEYKSGYLCELIVTGNSRLRIFNDYEDGLINKNNIICNGNSINLLCHNPKKIQIVNKCYLTLHYFNKIPNIEYIWDYNNFTPSYILYPIRIIKQETLDLFKIPDQIQIDYFEIEKNEKILYNEFGQYEYDSYNKKNNKLKKIHYPNIISKYGKLITIQNKNTYTKNSLSESDETPNDSENEELTDVSVFDELQYN
jgi:hypothetical protein